MAGRLTTHVLDTAHGLPAKGLLVELFRIGDDGPVAVVAAVTNRDGRCDNPLLEGDGLTPGVYELVFHVGDYFETMSARVTDPPFLDAVPVRFAVADSGEHYHVPLLVSPYGYSTYRGS